mgnify:CR=1 FL=1
MIKYKLNCKKCNLNFDSWFASSKEFEKLKKKKLLNCHNCNSLDIDKCLMAPKMISKNSNIDTKKDPIYGLNQLPDFISPFPKNFQFELQLLKTTLGNYLDNTFTIS